MNKKGSGNKTKMKEGEISYEQFLAIVRRFFPHVVKVKERE